MGLYKTTFRDVKLRQNAVFVFPIDNLLLAILESMNNLRTSQEHETKCDFVNAARVDSSHVALSN